MRYSEAIEALKPITEHDAYEDKFRDACKLAIKAMELQVAKKPYMTSLYDKKGNDIDDIMECGNCGAFICYPTEYDIKEEYKFCHKCGFRIDWSEE